jgi:hypothetical protein
MGPLFTAILTKQFAALRDGDRFFYLNENFTRAEQSILQQGNTLTKVIEANTPLTNLQSDAMLFAASIRGTVFNDLNGDGVQERGEESLSGRVVELEDANGNVLATTRTDSNGRYAFSNLNGITTGQFQVLALPPNGVSVTTPNPVTVTFTRGDQSFTVNLGEVKHVRSGSAAASNSLSPSAALATAGNPSGPAVAAPSGAPAAALVAAPTPVNATAASPSAAGTTGSTSGGTGAAASAATPQASLALPPGANGLMLLATADAGGPTTDALDAAAVDALVLSLAPPL